MALVAVTHWERARLLTLQRPDKRNALDTALLGELLDAVGEAAGDAGVRVIVLAGAGQDFCAGADVDEPLDHAGRVRWMELFTAVGEALATSPTPTVAALSGACVGGGAELAAACDLRVAEPGASFRFPGAARGYPVGAAKLVGLVGLGTAKDLVLTGRTVEVDEALRLGLVQRVAAEEGAALGLARTVADEIAAGQPEAIHHLRRQLATYTGAPDRVAAEHDLLRALTEAGGDYDAIGGVEGRGGAGGFAAGNWVRR